MDVTIINILLESYPWTVPRPPQTNRVTC